MLDSHVVVRQRLFGSSRGYVSRDISLVATCHGRGTYGVGIVKLVFNHVDVLALTLRIVSLILVRLASNAQPGAVAAVDVSSRWHADVAQYPLLCPVVSLGPLTELLKLAGRCRSIVYADDWLGSSGIALGRRRLVRGYYVAPPELEMVEHLCQHTTIVGMYLTALRRQQYRSQ